MKPWSEKEIEPTDRSQRIGSSDSSLLRLADLVQEHGGTSAYIWAEFFGGIHRHRRGTARFMADALRPTVSVSTDRLTSISAKPDNEYRDSRTLMEWVAGAGLSGATDAPWVSGFCHSAPATNFMADEALVLYSK